MSEDSELRCPRCPTLMDKENHLNCVIDRCGACGGGFFDEGELLAILGRPGDPMVWAGAMRPGGRMEIGCPRCKEPMIVTSLNHDDLKVDIDRCTACGGVWLDSGEVETLQRIGLRRMDSIPP